jgi:bifunctional UDP-N-acetylglucosamine pyrophosphorylase/glucosamine-1-phosphate N-acetyltransferase
LSLNVVVLAAGQGTRMRSDLPKVMHPLAGRPMVRYAVDAARTLTPENLVVVVGFGAELVRQAVAEDVLFVIQQEQLGTGHAVLQAEQAIAGRAESVLVLYGDTPLVQPETLLRLLEQHETSGSAVTVLTSQPGDPTGYGRIVREAGTERVLTIVEEVDATPKQKAIGEVSSGIFCFRDRWLWPNLARLQASPKGEFYLTSLVELACEQQEVVSAFQVADPLEVIGLDNRPKLARGEAEMRRRINERWMLSGVTLIDPDATYIEAGAAIGTDTVIWPNSYLQGNTRVGCDCVLGPGTVIRDSRIGDRCRIEMSVIEEALVEDDCEIGPFGHLRRGAHLAKGVHMGNFGEVKNSYLGPGVKMGHFSYLGDATVGPEANIGAGTITCNYDGKQKHRTIIGKGAFVGSDTMLVAPVEIGDGARTGAGSVVTRDVPPGRMAYGVPAQVRDASARPNDKAGAGEANTSEVEA